MMKIRNLLFWLCIALTFNGYTQDRSGIITYKGVVNEIFVDSFLTALKAKKDLPMGVKQRVTDDFLNATPDDFVLNFKNNESYFYYKPSLNAEEGYNMGSRAGTTPYYTNNATDTIIGMTRYLGNIAHDPLNWDITNKTKKIGNYQCYGATVTEKLYSRKGGFYYRHVTAWFTPEIPLNFGPQYFKGLPGLILQIERDDFTLTAIELNLNPENDVKIKRLDKNDRVITEAEAYGRVEELEADMRKKYRN